MQQGDAGEHQPGDPVGVLDGEVACDATAEGVAHDDEPVGEMTDAFPGQARRTSEGAVPE